MMRLLSKMPLRVSAPLVLALPVVLAVVSIGAVSYWQGRSAVHELETRGVAQIHARIADRLKRLLDGPVRWNQRVVELLHEGRLDPDNPDTLRARFFDQAQVFDRTLAGICWGAADAGQTAWVFRYEGNDYYDWGLRDASTDWLLHEYRLTDSGLVDADVPPKTSTFDPRERPWYTMAAEAQQPLWGEPYVWVSEGRATSSLGLPYMSPVWRDDGELWGVIDVEVGLRDLSGFLAELEVGATGLAFVMDRGGRLIATSVGAPLAEEGERLAATSCADGRIADVAVWLRGEAKRVRVEDTDATPEANPSDAPGIEGPDDVSSSDPAQPDSVFVTAWPSTVEGTIDLPDGPALVRLTQFRHEHGVEWLVVTVVPEADFTAGIEAARQRGMVLAAAAVLLTLLLGMAVSIWMIRPLVTVSRHVRSIGEGDLETELHLDHSPEVRELSSSINEMTAGLRDRLQIRKSLAMAMEVQQNLLPSDTPHIPGLDIAGHSIYCDETGGDYYDYLDIHGDAAHEGVSVVIGDVMGHGIAAAMLMATARGVLRSRSRESGSLADLLNHLNELLVEVTAGKRFMTMLMLSLDGNTKTMRWASAGHDAPFIYDPATDSFTEIDGGGLPLGVADFERYEEYRADDLAPGTIIVGATDGMWESRNPEGEMHGKERLMDVIRTHADKDSRTIATAIHEALYAFRGDAEQDDDETYVVVKVLGPDA